MTEQEATPIAFAGNLTKDPDPRYTASGTPVTTLNVAVNDRVQNEQGEWVDSDPVYYIVSAWRDQAERAAVAFAKGDRVVVMGRLKVESREYNGKTYTDNKVNADDVGPSMKWKDVEIRRTVRETPAAPEPF